MNLQDDEQPSEMWSSGLMFDCTTNFSGILLLVITFNFSIFQFRGFPGCRCAKFIIEFELSVSVKQYIVAIFDFEKNFVSHLYLQHIRCNN